MLLMMLVIMCINTYFTNTERQLYASSPNEKSFATVSFLTFQFIKKRLHTH